MGRLGVHYSPPSGLRAALAGALDMPRVAAFIDWQNAYKSARSAFGLWELPNEKGNFIPYSLARILATGNGRGKDGELVRVEIHRGLPSNQRDPDPRPAAPTGANSLFENPS